MAQIKVKNTHDLLAIAKDAGQSDPFKVLYKGDSLHVHGVTQAALDQAVLAADPLAALRKQKKAEIKLAFAAALAAGHTCTLPNNMTIHMDAGMSDALSLDGASRMAARAAIPDVVIRDASNKTHTLALASLDAVVDQLGSNYQTLLSQKWAHETAIDDVAITEINLKALVW